MRLDGRLNLALHWTQCFASWARTSAGPTDCRWSCHVAPTMRDLISVSEQLQAKFSAALVEGKASDYIMFDQKLQIRAGSVGLREGEAVETAG